MGWAACLLLVAFLFGEVFVLLAKNGVLRTQLLIFAAKLAVLRAQRLLLLACRRKLRAEQRILLAQWGERELGGDKVAQKRDRVHVPQDATPPAGGQGR